MRQGGAGQIDIIEQVDANTYKALANFDTASGVRTGLFVPEYDLLFVAVLHRGSQPAEIHSYQIEYLGTIFCFRAVRNCSPMNPSHSKFIGASGQRAFPFSSKAPAMSAALPWKGDPRQFPSPRRAPESRG